MTLEEWLNFRSARGIINTPQNCWYAFLTETEKAEIKTYQEQCMAEAKKALSYDATESWLWRIKAFEKYLYQLGIDRAEEYWAMNELPVREELESV